MFAYSNPTVEVFTEGSWMTLQEIQDPELQELASRTNNLKKLCRFHSEEVLVCFQKVEDLGSAA